VKRSQTIRRGVAHILFLAFAVGVTTAPQANAYVPPVDAPIIAEFQAPITRYGAGKRGLDYGSEVGQPVIASASGTVMFAGQVAGRLAVSLLHSDGITTTYTDMASVTVRRSAVVIGGSVIGASGTSFHFGAKRGDRYIDPASLFGTPYLVPLNQTIGLDGNGQSGVGRSAITGSTAEWLTSGSAVTPNRAAEAAARPLAPPSPKPTDTPFAPLAVAAFAPLALAAVRSSRSVRVGA